MFKDDYPGAEDIGDWISTHSAADRRVVFSPMPCTVCQELLCLDHELYWHAECCHCSKALDECSCHARGEN